MKNMENNRVALEPEELFMVTGGTEKEPPTLRELLEGGKNLVDLAENIMTQLGKLAEQMKQAKGA